MSLLYLGTPTNDGTYQVRLYETGVVEYVYGAMSRNSGTSAATSTVSIGFSVGTSANTTASITTSSNTVSNGATFNTNTYTAGSGAITNLNSSADGSRRYYRFTPPSVANDPTTMTFTSIGAQSMTLNWVDNSTSEVAFLVTRATDAAFTQNVVTATVASTTSAATGGAYTSAQTGLTVSTTYYYRVQAVNEGTASVGLTGSQVTAAPRTITSVATGNWSAGATWDVGVAPSSVDNAVIAAGHTVTIDVASLSATNVTVNATGVLAYGATPSSFSVLGNLSISGTFNVFNGTTGKTLNVAGNITNSGTLNLSTGTSTIPTLVLNGTTAQTISGTAPTGGYIGNLTINNTATNPLITWGWANIIVSSSTVSGTLTITSGNVNLGANELTLGVSTSILGTLTYNSTPRGGFITSTGGKFSRWIATGTSTFGSVSNTTYTGLFPFVNSLTGDTRLFYLAKTGSASVTGGKISVYYDNATGITTGLSITETTLGAVDRRTNASWAVTTTATLGSAVFSIKIRGVNFGDITDFTKLTPVLASNVATGTYSASTVASNVAEVNRTSVTAAGLLNTFYIGSSNVNALSTPIYSAATGDWSAGATWVGGVAPTSADNVVILTGHTVTSNAAGTAKSLTIIGSGALVASSSTLDITNTITNNGTITVSGGAVTVTGASTIGIINNTGSAFNLNSGTVTLGPIGGSNRAFTSTGTLTVSGGTLNINGALSQTCSAGNTFTHSGGNINVDGNAAGVSANSVTGNIVTFSGMTPTLASFSGGTFTIVDPHASSSSAYVLSAGASTAVNCSTSHTFYFGDGVSTDPGTTAGFYFYLFPSSSYLVLGNVVVNGGLGVNRFVTSTSNVGILGDLTINTNSEYRTNTSANYLAGNLINNGLFTNPNTLTLGSYSNATYVANTTAQSIGGSGVFRNAVPVATIASGGTGYVVGDVVTLSGGTFTTAAQFRVTTVSSGAITALQSINYPIYSAAPTYNASLTGGTGSGATVSAVTNILNTTAANMASLTVNNTNATGVTLNVPLSISGTFTLTSGLVNTTMTNLLQVGTATTNASLSFTHNATTMITGPFARTFIANRSTSGATSVALPLGKNGIPMRLDLDANTAATGPVIMVGEAFNSNNGIAGAGVSNLSTKTWSVLALSGSANLTNIYVKATDAGVTATSKLLHSATIDGTYNGTPGGSTSSGAAGTITTSAPITAADYLGNFAYGDLTACTAPTTAATNFAVFLKTNSSFTGSFTAAAGTPTGYLVLRMASGVAPTLPTDGTLYTANASALGGTIVGNYYTAPFTFTQSSLASSTTFDYYIYSFNNSGCAGPAYYATPLTASVTTCSASTVAPGTPTSSAITSNSFTTSWAASSTAGVTYELDVATDIGFTSFLAGYNARDVGNVLTFNITGLNPSTTYYVRVKAVISGCYSSNSSSLTVATVAVPVITSLSANVCNGPTTLTITGTGLTGATAVTVGGVAVSAILTNTATTITATVAAGNSGVVSVTNPGGTANSATSYFVGNLGNLTVTPNFARCSNSAASVLTVSSSNDPNYTYTWSPATGLSATTGASITTSATTTTTYTVTATNTAGGLGNGCITTGSVAVTVNANPSTPTVTPASTTMCSNGAAVQLTASGSVVNGTATIGTGTSVSAPTATNNTYMPNVYGNYYGGTKVQSLILASELTAATLIAGSSISSIAFEVGTAGSNTLNSFKVKVGHSSLTALSGNFQTGLTEVYSGTISSQATGFGTVITFSTPFVWDGTSNLIVETSYSNNDGGNTSTTQTMKVTTTAFASTQSYRVDSNTPSAVEAATTPTYTESERPNIRFAYTNTGNYTWASTTGLFTDAGATAAYAGAASTSVYAKPSSTTTYTATATTAAGCTATNTATVTVNNPPTAGTTTGNTNLLTTGLNTTTLTNTIAGGAWSSGNTGIATVDPVTGVVTAVAVGSSTIIYTLTNSCGATPVNTTVNVGNSVASTNGGGSCAPFGSVTINAANGNNNTWIPVFDGTDVVFAVNANGNDLGVVSGSYFRNNGGSIRTLGSNAYLDRNVGISAASQPTTPVSIRFYMSAAEYTALGTAAGFTANAGTGKVGISHVAGGNCAATFTPSGTPTTGILGDVTTYGTDFYVQFNTPSFSGFYVNAPNVILPIELKAFTAAAQGSANRLNWVTASEQNVSHFVIERSEDGRTNWTAIAQTKAVGNSQVEQKYQIFDSNPTNLAYYRLRSVDNNAKTQLSAVVSVLRQTNKLTLVTAAPMPFTDNLMVEFAANRNANVTVTILDLMGRVVHTEQIDALDGMNRNYLNLSKLANGAYILNINDGEYNDNRRIIKQQ